jgi:hypothetical protein
MAADGIRISNCHEFDIRPSTFACLQEQPSPAGGVVPADPSGITLLANGQVYWKKGGSAFDYFSRQISPKTDQGGEMIYWERPQGGRVFQRRRDRLGLGALGGRKNGRAAAQRVRAFWCAEAKSAATCLMGFAQILTPSP